MGDMAEADARESPVLLAGVESGNGEEKARLPRPDVGRAPSI
jgi:hypothetical protein